MIQFYAPEIISTGVLPPDESIHCIRVLRHREGDRIQVIDGTGNRCECVIVGASPREVTVDIVNIVKTPPHWPCRITLAVAPTKNMDRMEWLTEKAVEIGVDAIIPLICARSERKILKTERLQKIAVSAMKQSLKATLPHISDTMGVKDYINLYLPENPSGQLFMGYCDRNYPLRRLVDCYQSGSDVTILIGPEGDFSPEEVEMCVNAGFIPVTFGDSRLRTETAALSALDTIHILNLLNS